MTLIEVVVVVGMLFVVAIFILPQFAHKHSSKWWCVNHLNQIDTAFRLWAIDHSDKFPLQISTANGGTMELAGTENVVATFQIMSNELNQPRFLICPADTNHFCATNFSTDFSTKNISYFVGLNTNTNHPQMFLSGDDNFEIGGIPVKSGLLELSTNAPIAWTSSRHVTYKTHFWTPTQIVGNIGLADGSVQQVTTEDLQKLLQQTGIATNRFAIP